MFSNSSTYIYRDTFLGYLCNFENFNIQTSHYSHFKVGTITNEMFVFNFNKILKVLDFETLPTLFHLILNT